MKILFAASELTPIAKVGGLGDVAGALPKALKNLGADIRVVLPRYDVIDEKKYPLKFLGETKVKFGQVNEIVKIYETKIPNSEVIVYLLENKNYLTGGGVYFEKSAFVGGFQEIKRFLFFSVALLEIFPVINWQPEIIHCQDWHTAILPMLVKLQFPISNFQFPKTLFTIHNLANQGRWNAQQVMNFLGFKGDEWPTLQKKQIGLYGEDINLIQQGILNGDIITTVSPAYAQEIVTKTYFARGLKGDLQSRRQNLYGILNGIDAEVFNPATDPYLKYHYSLENFKNKIKNKLFLQKKLKFKKDKKAPLLGLVSRLVTQKGIDLIYEIIDEIIALKAQVVFLGVGEEQYEKMLLAAAKKYPRQISVHLEFNPQLAQEIYAGADIFLVPSRFEPCGLTQMIAMRYGTVPIGRNTGGLKDTVKNIIIKNEANGLKIEGTGFLFHGAFAWKLLKAIKRAISLYQQPAIWQKIQANDMKQDFSWQASAKKYLNLYHKLSD